METTVKVMLGYHPKADKTYPVNLRLTHNRKTTFIPINIAVKKDDFDEKTREIKKSCKLYEEIRKVNSYINKKKIELNSIVNELYDSGEIETMTAKEIKSRFLNKADQMSFGQFVSKLVDEFKKTNRLGNAAIYEQVKNLVLKFNNENDLDFSQINFTFLKNFEIDHISRGNKYNSLSVYLRTIRSIYNKAIKEGFAKADWYPFDKYSIKSTTPEKRAIDKSDIVKIENFKTIKDTQLFHAKNFFLFSFYMVGINYMDLAFLTKSNFINDRLEYRRKKTAKIYSLKMSEKAQSIYKYYKKNMGVREFVFPIINRKDPEDQRKDIRNGLKQYNKYLKLIGKELEIEKKLTSYVARHSWASTAKNHAPVQLISEALGHTRISTTQSYLDSFDNSSIDELNDIVIS